MELQGRKLRIDPFSPVSLLLLSILLLLVPSIVKDNYILHVLILIGIFVMATSSYNLMVGITGQLSLGHAAFFGIGAYSSALLAMNLGVNPWLALPLSGLISAVAGLAIGLPSLRLIGPYFTIVTLGFAEIVRLIATFESWLTGGPSGLPGIPPFSPVRFLWLNLEFNDKASYYYVVVILSLITVITTNRIIRSDPGKMLISIREDEVLAEHMGVDVMRYKIFAFIISSFFAGIAGGFYAHFILVLSPYILSIFSTTDMLVMMFLGGVGTIHGPVVGSIVGIFLWEQLREVGPEIRWIIFGLILIVIIFFFPRGIVGEISERVRRKRMAAKYQRA